MIRVILGLSKTTKDNKIMIVNILERVGLGVDNYEVMYYHEDKHYYVLLQSIKQKYILDAIEALKELV
jgi:hypothetical protein